MSDLGKGERLLLGLLADGATMRRNEVCGEVWLRLSSGGNISPNPSDWDALVARGWADPATGKITDQGRRQIVRTQARYTGD